MINSDAINNLLQNCNELSAFCSQNGWIINDSIRYEILEQDSSGLSIYVTFLESIMEGSGCQGNQKDCYGRLKLKLDGNGQLSGIDII